MKYAVPNEEQIKLLSQNGIDHRAVFLKHATDDYFVVQHFRSGDEITIRPGAISRRTVLMSDGQAQR